MFKQKHEFILISKMFMKEVYNVYDYERDEKYLNLSLDEATEMGVLFLIEGRSFAANSNVTQRIYDMYNEINSSNLKVAM